MTQKIKIGIVGGTGYTGVELLRLLAQHPQAEISVITSRSEAGIKVADLYPNLRHRVEVAFSEPSDEALSACNVVFFATPHGVAMAHAPMLTQAGVKIIDLAADFRLQDIPTWEQWYGMTFTCPDILKSSVYGLPEIVREDIKKAQVIGNPGCYPTATQLGLMPLIKKGWIDLDDIVVDAKSGVSGAGRGAKVEALFSETAESFKAYGVKGHRHQPEIVERLSIMAGQPVSVTFVPHLVPMIRGIEVTIYANLTKDISQAQLQSLYEDTYKDEFFVDVLPSGSTPDTRSVKGSNLCRMAVYRPLGGKKVVITSVIDNLVKGAAGQAVQNMNLLFGLPESLGLEQIALMP
jgi:N-acetyl-gamma-glutamyl-phosphate reductase